MLRYFVDHPTAANLMMVALLVLGLFSLPSLQRETFPRISPKKVQVQVVYPGATPDDVVQAICLPVEDALDGVDNLHEVICEARENSALVTATMGQGADLEIFTSDIKREVDSIDSFPATAEDPLVSQLGRSDFVASIAVTGSTNATDLKALAEEIKERMANFGGVPKIEVQGFSDPQIRIEIQNEIARALGLSLYDISNALTRQNIDLPGGEIESPFGITLLRFSDERGSLDAYRDIVVRSAATGGQTTLGQIASISAQFEDDEVKIAFDGKPAALLRITKTPQDDTLDVMNAVRAFLKNERQRLPPGVELTISNDGSQLVRDRLTLLSSNALQGLALVFAVMWLFFGFRHAFWISMGLPVSFLGALALMAALGYSINMLTMVGLLIVIGILMDDAIVIAENIASHRHMGKTPTQAAVAGAKQVGPGVIASFLTTAAVFGSLAFLKGDLGEILGVVPVVMLLVLSVSLIEAFLILPNHLSHSSSEQTPNKMTQALERGIDWMRDQMVGPMARKAVQFRYFTAGIGIFLLLATLSLMAGGLVKFVAFPELDGDIAEARIQLRQGATLAQTEVVLSKVRHALDQVDQAHPQSDGDLVKHITIKYAENADAQTNGPHLATIIVDLLGAEARNLTMDQFLQEWREAIPQDLTLNRLNITKSAIGPAGRAIELRLSGADIDQLEQASSELQSWFLGYDGVFNIADDLNTGKPELSLSLKDGAGTLDIDARMIAEQLRAAFYGITADEIQLYGESVEIDVRLSGIDRDSLEDFENFAIMTPQGLAVPLTSIVDISHDQGFARIKRVNRQIAVTITGDVDTNIANANEIVGDTQNRFLAGLLERYPDIRVGTEGQNAEAAETQASMLRGLLLGLIAVYLLLAFQFRSYSEPLAVMSVIPFTMVGAVFGHLIMGIDFAMPSMLGMIALAGVVVNGSILLVNFMKNEHEPGETSLNEIASAAAKNRFRAILLTSITTIAGVVPLLFESSLQAQILIPLVTSIAFGLIAVTLLILLVVPAFYGILHDFKLTTLNR